MGLGTQMAPKIGLPHLEKVRENRTPQFRLLQALLNDEDQWMDNFEEIIWPQLKRENYSNGIIDTAGSSLKEDKRAGGGNDSALRETNNTERGSGSALREEKNSEGGNGTVLKEENNSKGVNGYVLSDETIAEGGDGSVLGEERNFEGGNSSTLREERNFEGGNSSTLREEKTTEGRKNKFDVRSQNTYSKTKGVASMKGQMFEIKMSALLYLRAKNNKTIQEFHLGNNVEGAAAYDDLLLKVKKVNDPIWKTCFIQLKHKETASIGLKTCMGKGDLALTKYLQSYKEIKARMEKPAKGFLFEGSFENCQMVLYTNAKLHQEIAKRERHSKTNDIDELFKCDSKKQVIFNFNKDCDQEIFEQLVNDGDSTSEIVEFLSAFRVFSGQPSENKLDEFVKKELLIATDMIKPNIDIIYHTFIENIKKWWSDDNFTLNHESDIMKRTLETCKVNIMCTRAVKQHVLDLTFRQDVVSSPDHLCRAPLTHIVCNEMSTKLSCTKLVQSLQNSHHGYIFLSLGSLLKEMDAVMSAWSKQETPLLIIACEWTAKQENLSDLESMCVTLSKRLQNYTEIRLIVVSSSDCTFTTTLKNWVGECNIIEDNIHVNHLEMKCKEKFLSKEISFQGQLVKLNELFKGVDDLPECVFNDDFVQHILQKDILRIGPLLDKTVSNYIPRTLSRNDALKKELLKESSDVFIVHDISIEDLQKLIPENESIGHAGDRSKHRFQICSTGNDADTSEVYARNENVHELKMDSDRILRWVNSKGSVEHIKPFIDESQPSLSRPKTAMDFESRILVISGCPGMGKSSLFSHLYNTTKAAFPSAWVVRVNLLDHIDILESIKLEDEAPSIRPSLEDGVDFLEAALGIGRTSLTERALFRHSVKVKGNAVVFLDGFDEISPKYTQKGLNLLSSLRMTKLSKIFISTRQIMKNKLENSLSVLSFSLLPFNQDDQMELICKLLSGDEGRHQECQVVKEPLEKILFFLKDSFHDLSEVLGVPEHSETLAKMLENKFNDLLFHSEDLLSLFESFIDRKLKIHMQKRSDMFQNVDYEIKELHKRVLNDHMYAALVSLLDSNQLKSLNKANKIIERNELFCRQIEESKIKVGIVDKCLDNKAIFINRLFGEYLVALYMSKHIKENETFLHKHLSSEEFKVVTKFLELMLAKDKAFINNDISVSKL